MRINYLFLGFVFCEKTKADLKSSGFDLEQKKDLEHDFPQKKSGSRASFNSTTVEFLVYRIFTRYPQIFSDFFRFTRCLSGSILVIYEGVNGIANEL